MAKVNEDSEFPIQGRWLLILWFVPYFWLPWQSEFSYTIASLLGLPTDTLLTWGISYYLYVHLLVIVVIALLCLINRRSLKGMYSPIRTSMILPSLEITAFSFILSSTLVYAVFLPLSYLTPHFVESWLIYLPPLVVPQESLLPSKSNLLSLLSLAVFAPILEETIFRGLLLQRWASKYGSYTAIMLSSAIFACLHTDPAGAFVFGLLMSFLLIRSGTLLLPIMCHALYNFTVWLIHYVDIVILNNVELNTLAKFQNEWFYFPIYGLISVAMFYRLSSKVPPLKTWLVPKLF